jgi:catechol 2,3-dioxygenase-like lactoylglutathione lyase family enzyme
VDVRKIRHTGIVVRDLDESLAFYHDLLGFSIAEKAEESGPFIDTILGMEDTVVVTVKMRCADGQMIELLEYRSNSRPAQLRHLNDIGITHVALEVDDLSIFHEKLSHSGIEFISAPEDAENGCARVAFCCAPEGTHIELVQILRPELQTNRPSLPSSDTS